MFKYQNGTSLRLAMMACSAGTRMFMLSINDVRPAWLVYSKSSRGLMDRELDL